MNFFHVLKNKRIFEILEHKIYGKLAEKIILKGPQGLTGDPHNHELSLYESDEKRP